MQQAILGWVDWTFDSCLAIDLCSGALVSLLTAGLLSLCASQCANAIIFDIINMSLRFYRRPSAVNLMYDRRVYRGSTFAAKVLTPVSYR